MTSSSPVVSLVHVHDWERDARLLQLVDDDAHPAIETVIEQRRADAVRLSAPARNVHAAGLPLDVRPGAPRSATRLATISGRPLEDPVPSRISRRSRCAAGPTSSTEPSPARRMRPGISARGRASARREAEPGESRPRSVEPRPPGRRLPRRRRYRACAGRHIPRPIRRRGRPRAPRRLRHSRAGRAPPGVGAAGEVAFCCVAQGPDRWETARARSSELVEVLLEELVLGDLHQVVGVEPSGEATRRQQRRRVEAQPAGAVEPDEVAHRSVDLIEDRVRSSSRCSSRTNRVLRQGRRWIRPESALAVSASQGVSRDSWDGPAPTGLLSACRWTRGAAPRRDRETRSSTPWPVSGSCGDAWRASRASRSQGRALRRAWSHPAAAHVHPHQEERFEVLAGTLQSVVDGRRTTLEPGDVAVIPPGRSHTWRNVGDKEARVLGEFRPALRTEMFFETPSASRRTEK